MTKDEFTLTDSKGSVRIFTGITFFAANPGDTVTVTGFGDEDLFMEVDAQEILPSTGEVISITRSG